MQIHLSEHRALGLSVHLLIAAGDNLDRLYILTENALFGAEVYWQRPGCGDMLRRCGKCVEEPGRYRESDEKARWCIHKTSGSKLIQSFRGRQGDRLKFSN